MAKSLRSKFKRKVRAIARVKKEPKAAALLQKALDRRTEYEALQAEKAAEASKTVAGSDKNEDMDDGTKEVAKATINLKTMKKADGSYPVWLSEKKKKKLGQQKKKAAKKNKQKGRR